MEAKQVKEPKQQNTVQRGFHPAGWLLLGVIKKLHHQHSEDYKVYCWNKKLLKITSTIIWWSLYSANDKLLHSLYLVPENNMEHLKKKKKSARKQLFGRKKVWNPTTNHLRILNTSKSNSKPRFFDINDDKRWMPGNVNDVMDLH